MTITDYNKRKDDSILQKEKFFYFTVFEDRKKYRVKVSSIYDIFVTHQDILIFFNGKLRIAHSNGDHNFFFVGNAKISSARIHKYIVGPIIETHLEREK